ncbi:divergent polysaccharide deacetylase family protein [Yoonia sp.]|uniref:divergent polysaccharide deacetylase family protein n=1 Tax=Yoonia sp. TaxID=2212373 RepID=UPI00358E5DDB
MRGFIQGSLWGLILGISGLSFASLVTEQPNYAAGPDAPQFVTPELDATLETPTVALQTKTDETPGFAPVAPLDDVAELAEPAPEVSTEPAELPQTAEVAGAIESPAATSETTLSTVVDAPAAPRVETPLIAPDVVADVPEVDTATIAPVPAAPLQDNTPSDTPSPEIAANTSEAGAEPSAAQTIPPAETATQEPVQEPAPIMVETAPAPQQEPAAPVAPAVTVEAPSETGPVTVTEALPQTGTAVRINRPGTPEQEPIPTVEDTSDTDALPEDAPALLRFAAPYDDAGAPAKIAIVLIDDAQMSGGVRAVSDLGFTPTVVVNALSSDAADVAAAYRAAGVEVAMQAALPDGAQPTDVEVAFEAALATSPEVAMLFSDGTGAMQDRDVTTQVMQILAADGYGFVSVQRGLSNAARTAEQAGVPAATILRDIDGAGENARAIGRALDQAAFRARQTGQEVLLGRMTPQTLEALRTWAADVDQDTLAITPVSAILLGNSDG